MAKNAIIVTGSVDTVQWWTDLHSGYLGLLQDILSLLLHSALLPPQTHLIRAGNLPGAAGAILPAGQIKGQFPRQCVPAVAFLPGFFQIENFVCEFIKQYNAVFMVRVR